MDTPRPAGKVPTKATLLKFQIFLGLVAVVGGVVGFKTDYLDARAVLTDGVPGAFTLDRCDRVGGGSGQGPSTFCYGTFRSDDGRVVLEHVRLSEDHDAEDLEPGEGFAAHAVERERGPDQVVRSDGTGTGNLTARGVGWAGAAVLGLAVLGLAARRRMAPSPARERLGTGLGVLALGAGLAWLIGLGTGGGFLA